MDTICLPYRNSRFEKQRDSYIDQLFRKGVLKTKIKIKTKTMTKIIFVTFFVNMHGLCGVRVCHC